MFAFAIWDPSKRHVVLARDRLGIKPLYLCTAGSADHKTLFFASELRSLLAGKVADRRLNPQAVASYVWNGFVIGPETIIEGVQLLAAGSAAIVRSDGSLELQPYWKLPRYAPSRDGIERLSEALETSVRQHLVSDVPLGVFLSGGIDSSAVTAIAANAR
jgi:asparagine synthase (glutamine-hydrolysing)